MEITGTNVNFVAGRHAHVRVTRPSDVKPIQIVQEKKLRSNCRRNRGAGALWCNKPTDFSSPKSSSLFVCNIIIIVVN